jgi:hypothetical protein
MGVMKQIRERVATMLEAVDGIGKVYPRMRPVNLESIAIADFVKNNLLNAWFVSRRDVGAPEDVVMDQSLSELNDTISIHGFYAVNDANDSDTAFDELVDAVIIALNNDRIPPSKLNGLIVDSKPPRVMGSIDFRHFGPQQVLCHHVEIGLPIVRYLQGGA